MRRMTRRSPRSSSKRRLLGDEAEARIDRLGEHLIAAARARNPPQSAGIEDLLREYSLSSEEGLALMVLAEALLRVPDALTADRLIEDKIGAARSLGAADAEDSAAPSSSRRRLGARATARMIDKGKTAEGVIAAAARRIGMGALRAAARQAMQLMGAISSSARPSRTVCAHLRARCGATRYSFDMLGEGARTGADARALFRRLCACDRGDRRARPPCRARAARHLGQALRAASALRALVARGASSPS